MQADTTLADAPGTGAARPPRSFYIVGALALVWNLIGVAAFFGQVTGAPEALGETPEQIAFYEQIPTWAVSAFAVAVFAGTLACIVLLLRNKQAIPLFTVSLLAALAQNVYSFVLADGLAVFGGAAAALPALVIAIGIALLLYAMRALKRGWLR